MSLRRQWLCLDLPGVLSRDRSRMDLLTGRWRDGGTNGRREYLLVSLPLPLSVFLSLCLPVPLSLCLSVSLSLRLGDMSSQAGGRGGARALRGGADCGRDRRGMR